MTTPTLVTLDQFRDHLKLSVPLVGSPPEPGSPAPDDADLQLKLDTATELVCAYIAHRHPADEAWIAEIEGWSVAGSPAPPRRVVQAILITAADLERFRGDDTDDRPRERGFPLPMVDLLLSDFVNRSFA